MAAAVSVLASAITPRAGRAVTAVARVPCWTSEVNSSAPAIVARAEVIVVQ